MIRIQEKIAKILVAGDAGVGKTSLLKRYVGGSLVKESKMTVGIDFFEKTLHGDDRKYHLQIWDIAGQERFHFMVEDYLRRATGGLVLFDITNLASFVNVEKWASSLRREDPNLPLVLVASKCDLFEFSTVRDVLAENLKKKLDFVDYVKTSSKTGENVRGVFESLLRSLNDSTYGLESLKN